MGYDPLSSKFFFRSPTYANAECLSMFFCEGVKYDNYICYLLFIFLVIIIVIITVIIVGK